MTAVAQTFESHPFNIGDSEIVRRILWAEAADDPKGWEPKLNTYTKAMRGNEALSDTMKRVSSAYRGNSEQYIKATKRDYNDFENKVNFKLANTIANFVPDTNWNYQYHENPDLPVYVNHALAKKISNEAAMLELLPNHWGQSADYSKRVRIGKEFYFPPTVQRMLPKVKEQVSSDDLSIHKMVASGDFGVAFNKAYKNKEKTFWFDKKDGKGPQLYTTVKK